MAGREWVDECPGRFSVERELGNGYFATVYQAYDSKLKKMVAVKAVDKRKLTTEYANVGKINFEAAIMAELDHKYVCKLLDRTDTDTFILLILEFCTNGTLFNEIVSQSSRHLTKDESRRVFYQMVECVEYLHFMRCSHRDLKPENILFDDQMDIKVADFGLAFRFDPTTTTTESVGSLDYASPEVLLQYPYVGPEPDVWSMGVVLYAMLTGTLPFMGATDEDVFKAIVRGQFRIPRFLGEDVVEIIEACFTLDPHLRPSVAELRTFEFLWSHYGSTEEPPTRTSSVDSSFGVVTPREKMGLTPSDMLTDEQVKRAHKKMVRTESIRGSVGAVLGTEPSPRERTPTPKISENIEEVDFNFEELIGDGRNRPQRTDSGLGMSTVPKDVRRRGSAPDNHRMVEKTSDGSSKRQGRAREQPSGASARPHSMHLTTVEVDKAITAQQAVLGSTNGSPAPPKQKKKGASFGKSGPRISARRASNGERKSRRSTISFGKVSPLVTAKDIQSFDEEEERRRRAQRKRDPSYHRSLRQRVLGRKKRSGKKREKKDQEKEKKGEDTVEEMICSLTPKQRRKKEKEEKRKKKKDEKKKTKTVKREERGRPPSKLATCANPAAAPIPASTLHTRSTHRSTVDKPALQRTLSNSAEKTFPGRRKNSSPEKNSSFTRTAPAMSRKDT